MTKSSHTGTGDAPQNQNNAMSDDAGDGQRKSFAADQESSGESPPAPDTQNKDRLEELGREGAKQN